MKNLILLISFFVVVVLSCKKPKVEGELSRMGVVSGIIQPAEAASILHAANEFGLQVSTTADENTGMFAFNLPTGKYTITFATNPLFKAPKDISIIVNGKVDLGNIKFQQVPSGSISGKFFPQNGATSVQATNISTGSTTAGTIDYPTGTFHFPVLSAGSYKIKFMVNPPYLVPPELIAEVINSQATDLGTTSFVYDTNTRLLSFKINGVGQTRYNPAGSFQGGILRFSLKAVTMRPSVPEDIRTTHSTFDFGAANITGTGRYPLSGLNITLNEVVSSNASLSKITTNWSISKTTPTAELVVTAIDSNAKTIRGTFSATLVSDKTTSLNKTITDGRFFLDY